MLTSKRVKELSVGPRLSLLLYEHWTARLKEVDRYPWQIRETVRSLIIKEIAKNDPGWVARSYMNSQHYKPNLHPDVKWFILDNNEC